jgi:hypothetical protein
MKYLASFLFVHFFLFSQLQAQNTDSNSSINVRNYGAIPNDGLDDTQAIRSAIAAAVAKKSAQVILFEAGRYDLKESKNSQFIKIIDAANITLKGASLNDEPTTKLVRFNNAGEGGTLPSLLYIRNSKNIRIENFILDNDPYYYTAGKVVEKSGESVTVDILPEHPMNILKPYIMGIYDDLKDKNKKLRITWEKNLPTWYPIAGGSGRLLKLDFKALSDQVIVGDDVFWFQGNHGGIQCVTSKSEDIFFTNVITHNSTGFVYHFVNNHNITLEKVKIEPVGNRIAVSPRDGIHFASCSGLIYLNKVVVKNTPGDDGLNVHSQFLTVGSVSSKSVTFKDNIIADIKVNSRIQFLDAQFQPIWTGTVEKSTPTIANNTPVTVVFKEEIPKWITAGILANPLGWLPKSVIIKNSTFENTGRFGVIAKTNNVVIDSSTFKFNANAGVVFGSSFNSYFQEAQSPWNVVVKNSTFENNIKRMGNMGPAGIMVDQLFVENPNVNGNMYFFNNTFKEEQNAFMVKDAMNVHLWNNTFKNSVNNIARDIPSTSNFTTGKVFKDFITDDLAKGAIYYSQTWTVDTHSKDSLGSVTKNDQIGAFAEFSFVGNQIAYYARKDQNMGKVDVYLDDVLVLNDYDLFADEAQSKSLVYQNNNLENTTHTLRIENSGSKNKKAKGSFVNIDYLRYQQGNDIVKPKK